MQLPVTQSLQNSIELQSAVHSFSPLKQRSIENLTNSSQAKLTNAPSSPQFCARHTEPFISISPQLTKEFQTNESPILLPPHLKQHKTENSERADVKDEVFL
jgi:uncharacterized membrane protein